MSEPTVLHLTAVIVPEDDGFVSHCLEVGVVSQGDTVEEALANLREALELYFEDTPSMDEPRPGIGPHPIVAPIEVQIPA